MKNFFMVLLIVLVSVGCLAAEEKTVQMYLVNDQGIGQSIGSIKVKDTHYGLVFIPQLSGLPHGIHGFHVHQNPDCGQMAIGGKPMAAMAAGGHYDPQGTGKHEGPYGEGHLGDLPFLYVDNEGKSLGPVLAPRLRLSDVEGKSLMIHAGADNYSDIPEKLGGGGPRLACGVVR